jgi:two-component system sensor histidine kinase TctE
MMAARSLRLELLAWLLLPLAAVILFNVWTTYLAAIAAASLITDRTLLASARVIAEQIKDHDGVIEALIPPSALEIFVSDEPERVVYRVTLPSGELIAGYPDTITPPHHLDGLAPLYFASSFRGQEVRAVAILQPIISPETTTNVQVTVAETLLGRDRLAGDLWRKSLRDQLLLVSIASVLVLIGLNRGLAPLLRLRDEVQKREASALEPFALDSVQSELQPLVGAINDAFLRVRTLVATQRRFIANAAHQLRTPLALLKTQALVGLREDDARSKNEALIGIDRSVDGLTRLVNQLLALARAEQGSRALLKNLLDFRVVVRETLERLAGQAVARNIDLGFDDSGATSTHVIGHAALLQELVFNLVDNALRYAPQGATVNVSLHETAGELCLCVEDDGPGIVESERQKVFERFYRLHGSEVDGTGLGLAIVQEIVLAHDGRITLEERVPPPGLSVAVYLPVADQAAV